MGHHGDRQFCGLGELTLCSASTSRAQIAFINCPRRPLPSDGQKSSLRLTMSVFYSTCEGAKTDIDSIMKPLIRSDEHDVSVRLGDMKLTRDGLIDVLGQIFAEHGFCNENDPAGTRGWTVYRWGVRGLREKFRSKGWSVDSTGNLETLVHHALKIRIAVLNTDDGTCDENRIPCNTNEKGPNSERAALANADMLPGAEDWPETKADGTPAVTPEYETWHLCVYVRDDDLRAELSLLNKFSAGYFLDAAERIFLVKPSEWKPLESRGHDDSSGGSVDAVDFKVERKK
jgi:hypothetical protein